MTPTLGSLFSGIGGFDLGLERAGWECRWQVENDPQCRQVLTRHWPMVKRLNDVREVAEDDLEPVDLVCGGFPCQDLSVAGRRAGLAGERSGLFREFARIIALLAPRWVLIENVAGLLSSNAGRDMGTVLGTLGKLGYGWAYRVLDSQYFGVPQRRRRVFVVGRAGGFCPPEVLFEPESLSGHPPPSREAGARVAATLTRGAESQGHGGAAGRRREDDVNVVAALRSSYGGAVCQGCRPPAHEIAHTITGREGKGPDSDFTSGAIMAFQPKASVHQSMNPSALSPTLGTTKEPGVLTFTERGRPEGRNLETRDDGIANALIAPGGGRSGTGGGTAVLAPTFVHPRILRNSLSSNQMGIKDDGLSDALTSEGPGAVIQAIPRRLTPLECERLQGFNGGWTEGQSDSARYRQLGNAVTVPVIEWIGRRIREAK